MGKQKTDMIINHLKVSPMNGVKPLLKIQLHICQMFKFGIELYVIYFYYIRNELQFQHACLCSNDFFVISFYPLCMKERVFYLSRQPSMCPKKALASFVSFLLNTKTTIECFGLLNKHIGILTHYLLLSSSPFKLFFSYMYFFALFP